MSADAVAHASLCEDSRRAAAVIGGFPLPGQAPLAEFRALVPRICELVSTPGPSLAAVWDDVVGAVPVRVYVPEQASGDLLVYARGSGWVAGSIDSQDPLVRRLAAATGCPIVSVEYRLAPEHPFPAALDDLLVAVAHAPELIERITGDPVLARALVGQSAGGNLAAAAAIALRDRGVGIDLQVLIDPVLRDHRRAAELRPPSGDFAGVIDVLRWEWDQYLPSPPVAERLAHAVPWCVESVEGLPPALVVAAEHDVLAQEALTYGQRLRAGGIEVETMLVPGVIHGFLDHTRMGGVADRSLAEIAERIVRMLARAR